MKGIKKKREKSMVTATARKTEKRYIQDIDNG